MKPTREPPIRSVNLLRGRRAGDAEEGVEVHSSSLLLVHNLRVDDIVRVTVPAGRTS
jgi:hypothetical protein